jgi:7,8-dihydropterin-6-yl-methyl-4-(beta-D-ribofuranosyl)aminobenzene 5'-phosphate synthase
LRGIFSRLFRRPDSRLCLLALRPCLLRPPIAKNGVIPTDTLLAEHGLCLMITTHVNGESHTVLLDAGYSNVAVLHNLNFLDLTLDGLEAVVLSHGHMDHTGALKEVLELAGAGTKLIVHPDAFLSRSLNLPNGEVILFPEFPPRSKLSGWGADIMENSAPLLIGDDTVLVTGEVARTTSFEKGMPGTKIKHDSGLDVISRLSKELPDNFIQSSVGSKILLNAD